MTNRASSLSLVGALLSACTPSPQPAATARAAVEVPLTASLELNPDERPQMIGRRWLRQRATLTLHGREATLRIEEEWGVRDVRCPEELRGTSMQGCGSEAEARALEARVERAQQQLRGDAAGEGARLTLTLRAADAPDALTLRCARDDGGLSCDQPTGWPTREGFRAPTALRFARAATPTQ